MDDLRYFIHLNYNGAAYNGWQVQPDHPSVQQTLTECLSTVLCREVEVTGCGRTDTGVHARSYYVHFDHDGDLEENIEYRLNKLLPDDVGIYSIFRVGESAHARFDAVRRTYKYFIHFRKDVFLSDRSFRMHSYTFDIGKMNIAAGMLVREADFSAFEKKGSDNKTSVCKVFDAGWEILNDNQWCFTITADRFLRNMVRRITGALLMVGLGRMEPAEIETAMADRSELEVKIAVPAHGLFLWDIEYPKELKIDRD